ncbi:uncharacterized protein LOC130249814 [Oenanthe melanoleuca]|uniref:uncharacterized protein LOC130249814 n=1 Tax=Oenanthe melanoleuca TaxID=2939378 RepID=UPI0024C11C93|nr:uncharacterized protein LOC130249814 [Oenanthe melanoleuca]
MLKEGSFTLHHLLRVGGQKLIEVEEDYLKGTHLKEWYPRSPTEVHQELSIIHKNLAMYCPGSCFFLLTGCLIAASLGDPQHSSHQCFQSVPWGELLQEIEQLNKRGFSLECEEVSNEDLCSPEQMLKAVKYDNAAIVHIVHEIAEFFKRADTPFQDKNIFLRGMYEAHAQLKTCLKSRRNISHESVVKDCFKKMDEFVAKSNDHCIWQEIHAHSREILQRIENYSFKRRVTH